MVQDNTLTQTWRSDGARIQMVRDPGGEHAAEPHADERASRFAGTPATNHC